MLISTNNIFKKKVVLDSNTDIVHRLRLINRNVFEVQSFSVFRWKSDNKENNVMVPPDTASLTSGISPGFETGYV